jgi:hypothetical protein
MHNMFRGRTMFGEGLVSINPHWMRSMSINGCASS